MLNRIAPIFLVLLFAPLARAAEPVAFYDIQKAMAGSAEGKKNAADEAADLKAKQAQLKVLQDAADKAKAECDAYSKKYDQPAGFRVMERGPCDGADKKAQEAGALGQRLQGELQQRQQGNAQKLLARVGRVLPAVAKAKHLGALLPLWGAFYASPALDMTAEIVRRLDAGDGKEPVATAEERAEKAEARALAAEAEVERVRKLGLKAVGLAKTAVSERDKAVKLAGEAIDTAQRFAGGDDAALTKPAPPSVPPPPPIQPLAAKGRK